MDDAKLSLQKVTPLSSELKELSFKQIIVEEDLGDIEASIQARVVHEDDKYFEVLVTFGLGFDGAGPFELSGKMVGNYRKNAGMDAKRLLKEAPTVLYPIAAEISLLVATLTRSISRIPLIISPDTLVELSGLE